jgi:uncharacterized membrane protein YheB (UPF0754 family)
MEGIKAFILEWWPIVAPWLIYLVIPISAAIVGWWTNKLAIQMTFYPIGFKGWVISDKKPWMRLGWQGIIPLKAAKMAAMSTDMILEHLIDIKDVFNNLNPERIAEELESTVRTLARETMNRAMQENLPILWLALPKNRREKIIESAIDEFPNAVQSVMDEIKDDILDLWDVKGMVLEEIEKDRGIMNELFLRCGEEEFKFIEKSGFYFGFFFGLIQMVIWYFIQGYSWAWITLPAAGLIVGYLTNFIALKMIFEPEEPKKFGPIVFQGLLMKRQQEVSSEFGKVLANKLFTMNNIFDNIIYGHATGRIVELIESHVNGVVDKTAGLNRSFIQIAAGTKTYDNIKQMVVDTFRRELPDSIAEIFDYAENALDIEHTVAEKMAELPADEFLGFMRPVFKEDEWKLILIGALLGMGAGFIQAVLLVF